MEEDNKGRMNGVDLLRRLMRRHGGQSLGGSSRKLGIEEKSQMGAAPRKPAWEDPHAMAVWMQRVYAELVGEAQRLRPQRGTVHSFAAPYRNFIIRMFHFAPLDHSLPRRRPEGGSVGRPYWSIVR